jgi:beta-glucosidase
MTRLAAAGMTVLTNRDSVLPLTRGQTVALIGRHAVETIGMGAGRLRSPRRTRSASPQG